MTALTQVTVAQARDRLRTGEITAKDLARSCIDAIENAGHLNAFCESTPDLAMEMAEMADQRIAAGDPPKLCGIPLGIKDLFCTRGVRSQAASAILDSFRPEYESDVTERLWKAGAVLVGKTNMDEFAMGSSNQASVYGSVTSPWRRRGSDVRITPGGSSGGSAAAVAARLCLAATGTDTGGSIRQPAAFSGITGIKPTYGRCSRWGIIAFASSLDQAGPLTRSVRDAAILLETMAGHDPRDSTSADIRVPEFESLLTGDIRGRTIGIPAEYRRDGMPNAIERLWAEGAEMLRTAGARVIDVSLPHTEYALPAYYVIAPAEASSNLARYDGVRYGHRARLDPGDGIVDMYAKTRAEGFGPEVRRRILIGTYVLSEGFYDAYYKRAQRVRTLIRRDFERLFNEGVDAILTPTTPTAAFGLGEIPDDDPVQMYLNDIFTVTVNLAGLPGISVPAGLDESGLPLGLQLIGQPWQEGELLNMAYALEQAVAFDAVPEPWW
ncbi:MAG: Asp-tRNA(Asn)/Glu-tRNA(Gln) amidotransferase subunit GatA [Paracoccaceae bacterium]|nr:Asp-tRNA(Asn)/Glu-tRNA(Gln) amidotransferase subunit GatA [Paracoccaceae bacterium]